MKFWIKLICFVAIPCTLLGVLFGISTRLGIFRVENVRLEIKDSSDPYFQVVSNSLRQKLQHYQHANIWEIDVDAVTRLVKTESWVEDVLVQKRVPNEVVVEVHPKKVRAVFVTTRGRVLPISNGGDVMTEVGTQDAPVGPVVRDPRLLKESDLRTALIEVIRQLPENGIFSQASLAEVNLDRNRQFLFSLLGSGTQVRMSSENVPLKVGRVTKVLEYLETKNFQARVIDTDFSKKVLVKLRHRR